MSKRFYPKPFLTYLKDSAGVIPVPEIVQTAKGRFEVSITKLQLYQLANYHGWSLVPKAHSGFEVAKIMGVQYVTVRDVWLTGSDPPLLHSRDYRAGRPVGYETGQWWIDPGDLYQFVYQHPEWYDWRRIAREPHRTWGKKANDRKGLMFMEEVAGRLDVPYPTLMGWIHQYDIPGVIEVSAGWVRWRFLPESLPILRRFKQLSGKRTARPAPLRNPRPRPSEPPPRLLALVAIEQVGKSIRARVVGWADQDQENGGRNPALAGFRDSDPTASRDRPAVARS